MVQIKNLISCLKQLENGDLSTDHIVVLSPLYIVAKGTQATFIHAIDFCHRTQQTGHPTQLESRLVNRRGFQSPMWKK